MQERSVRQKATGRQRIMVIDDDRDLSQLVRDLDSDEYDTVRVEDSQLGLKLLESFSPDLIIIDSNATASSGFEILQKIREHSPVPVILLSSQDIKKNYDTAVGFGADDLIHKPFDSRVLSARIRAMLRRSRMNRKEPYYS